MNGFAKISTGVDIPFFVYDSTDRTVGKTGLSSFTITAAKSGETSMSTITPTVTEQGSGWYFMTLTTTHTNTKGFMNFYITKTGGEIKPFSIQVVTDLPGDIVASVTGAVGSVTGAVGSVTGNVGGNVVGTVASVVGAVGSVTGLTASNLDAPISSRLAAGTHGIDDVYSAISGISVDLSPVQTVVDAIQERTDNLPDDPAATGDIPSASTIAIAVLEQTLEGHMPSGSNGEAIFIAATKPDPDNTSITAIKTAVVTDFIPSESIYTVLTSMQDDNSELKDTTEDISDSLGLIDQDNQLTIRGEIQSMHEDESSFESDVEGYFNDLTDDIGAIAAANFKRSTAVTAFTFPMKDESGIPLTGLTVTSQVSKDGATFTDCDNTATEIGRGFYKIDLTTNDMDAESWIFVASADGAKDTEYSGRLV